MKRQQDRDSPSKGKRSHSNIPRYDDSPRDRTPDRRRSVKSPGDRRRNRESSLERGMPVGRQGGGSVNRGDMYYDYARSAKGERSTYPYKILCVTNLNPKVNDVIIRDTLLREFERFGGISVKVCHEPNELVAYIYFQTSDEAKEARHNKSRFVMFDKTVQLEPVYDRMPVRRNRSMTPDYVSHNARAPSPAHSTTSANSMGRRSVGGRHGSMERTLPSGYPPHHREAVRRDAMRSEFHHPQHRREESKKEKFPNYLHHVPPEEDDKATRTLFVGNLEVTISETELRRIFDRYGMVEDIDVKRPPPGQGNAYAFIKFLNLDMAHRAKVEMSGQYIGKFQCKIGYGKATPTTRIWVGGLGPWTSLSHLEREFDRFGAIRKIDFVKGDNHAYIQYDSIDAAQAACQEMRGFPLGGPDKRLRVDFADPGPYSYYQTPARSAFVEEPAADPYVARRAARSEVPDESQYYQEVENHWPRNAYANSQYDPHYDRQVRNQTRDRWSDQQRGDDRRGNGDYNRNWGRDRPDWWEENPHNLGGDSNSDRRKRPRTPDNNDDLQVRMCNANDGDGYKRPKRSPEPGERERTPSNNSPHRSHGGSLRRTSKERPQSDLARGESRSNKDRDHGDSGSQDPDSQRSRSKEDKKSDGSSVAVVESVTSIPDLAKCCPVAWYGALVLKNSAFPTRMLVCSGEPLMVDTLMKDSSDFPMLRITQRLRLDRSKLEDVSKKIANAGSHGYAILLTLPGSVQANEDQSSSVQQRPLRNLVSYLKQKEAAGVISLPGSAAKKDPKGELAGVLYAFPPCQFSLDLLRRAAPNLNADSVKEDHLAVVVLRGST